MIDEKKITLYDIRNPKWNYGSIPPIRDLSGNTTEYGWSDIVWVIVETGGLSKWVTIVKYTLCA